MELTLKPLRDHYTGRPLVDGDADEHDSWHFIFVSVCLGSLQRLKRHAPAGGWSDAQVDEIMDRYHAARRSALKKPPAGDKGRVALSVLAMADMCLKSVREGNDLAAMTTLSLAEDAIARIM